MSPRPLLIPHPLRPTAVLLLVLFALKAGAPGAAPVRAQEQAFAPRFMSLQADEVNVRAGPGTRYPIGWVFRRRGLPVEAIGRFENWVQVRDSEGDTGWIYRNLLSSARTAIVFAAVQNLYRRPRADSTILLKAEPGVVVRVMACEGLWCEVEVAEVRAFIPRAGLWGVTRDETFP